MPGISIIRHSHFRYTFWTIVSFKNVVQESIPRYQWLGRSWRRVTTWSSSIMTEQSIFRTSNCAIISLQRPHGGRIPFSATATSAMICVSRYLSISATAAASAQNPSPQARSILTPVYILPFDVLIAAPTEPAECSSDSLNSPSTDLAAVIKSLMVSFIFLTQTNKYNQVLNHT